MSQEVKSENCEQELNLLRDNLINLDYNVVATILLQQ